jgi:hypothetical protein
MKAFTYIDNLRAMVVKKFLKPTNETDNIQVINAVFLKKAGIWSDGLVTELEYYAMLNKNERKHSSRQAYTEYPIDADGNSDFRYRFNYLVDYDILSNKYRLHEIAGKGTTFVKALRIMDWITENTFYCGHSALGGSSSLTILDYSFGKGFDGAINCENKVILLSDCLLAVNIFAHPVVLESYDVNRETDKIDNIHCHVVVHVFLEEEERWIMLDPSFNAYITDHDGMVLNIFDMKKRLSLSEKIYLGQYSLNGHGDVFRDNYLQQFIIDMAFRINVHDGNSQDLRTYNQNLMFPVGIDRYKYYRMKQIANGIDEDEAGALYENVRFISINELLARPEMA